MSTNCVAHNSWNVFSYSSGGQQSKIKVWAGWFLLEALREGPFQPGSQWWLEIFVTPQLADGSLHLSCLQLWSCFPCVSLCVFSFSYKFTSHIGFRAHPTLA